MRARTSASQACGSTPFILAVTIRLYMAAARSPPRSEPQNSHDFLPRATPRSASLRGIVRQANAAIFEEQRERGPALEHVVDRLDEVVPARELSELRAHEGMEIVDQGAALRAARSQSLLRALAVDRALDLEQRVDAAHDLDRDRRQRDLLLARGLAPGVLLDVGHDEERTPGMNPTRRLPDRARLPVQQIKLVVAVIGVRLQDAGISRQMRLWMLAPRDRASSRTSPPAARRRRRACRRARKSSTAPCRSSPPPGPAQWGE